MASLSERPSAINLEDTGAHTYGFFDKPISFTSFPITVHYITRLQIRRYAPEPMTVSSFVPEKLQNPLAKLDRLTPELILKIMSHTNSRVTNTCLTLTCPQLYILHFGVFGLTSLKEIADIWWERYECSYTTPNCLFPPTKIVMLSLHQIIVP